MKLKKQFRSHKDLPHNKARTEVLPTGLCYVFQPVRYVRRRETMRKQTAYTTSLMICAMSWLSTPAFAGSDTAQDALKESQLEVRPLKNVVQNRFFLKTGRLELAPVVGYVPNNPMVKRYTGGILGAYHFSENFAAPYTGSISRLPESSRISTVVRCRCGAEFALC